MKHLLVSIAVLAALLSPQFALGQRDELISDVLVVGNEEMSTEAVLHHVRSRVGQRYDPRVVREDEKRLMESGRFVSVKVRAARGERGIVLTFEVEEKSTIESVHFQNNKSFNRKKLLRVLRYGPGDPLDQYRIESGRKAIEEMYREQGFQFVRAQATQKHRQIIYTIVEGPRVAVRKVIYQGNTHFSRLTLRQRLSTMPQFWPFVTGLLDLEKVRRDVDTLRNMYTEEGFLGAEVDSRVEYSPDKTKATVIFVIRQHQRYRIKEIQFNGNVAFDDTTLLSRINLRPGDFITQLAVRQDSRELRRTYGELGYIHATVEPRMVYVNPEAPPPPWWRGQPGRKPALVNIVFDIVERDRYRIGRIDVRGNTITQDRVILRELRFYPEDYYNTGAVDRAELRLRELRLFEEVNITPVGQEGKVRNVLVELKEARTAEFIVGVGVSTNAGLLGNISFTQRNFDITAWRSKQGRPRFKGAGQRFSIVAEPGTELMRFHINWFTPYIFDRPYSLGTKVYLFSRQRDSYDEMRYGPVVSVGHRFQNQWYGEIAARVEGVDISDLDSDAPPEVTQDEGNHLITGLKGSIRKNRTDSRWAPSRGDRFRVSYEQVVGDFNFGRIEGDYRFYRTLHMDALDRKHILATRVAMGQIIGDAPVFERFYGGGIGSIRGFRYRGISPRSKGTDSRIGGEFMVFVGTEYSFPLVGEQLRGVVFIDTGTVEETTAMSSYRASIGAGLRWTIRRFGLVPISLDFAVPLLREGDDEEQVVSFFLGWTF